MGKEYIYIICPACHGTGEWLIPPYPSGSDEPDMGDCVTCGGIGKVLWGYLQDELEGEE